MQGCPFKIVNCSNQLLLALLTNCPNNVFNLYLDNFLLSKYLLELLMVKFMRNGGY